MPGKFKVWAQELKALGLRGDEQVVDLGCGRGAVLTMAARLDLMQNNTTAISSSANAYWIWK